MTHSIGSRRRVLADRYIPGESTGQPPDMLACHL